MTSRILPPTPGLRGLALTASLTALAISAEAQSLGVAFVADTTTDSIWRLEDADGDGNYNGAGEVANYYDELIGAITLGNNTGITVAGDGVVYVSDSSSDIVLRLEDLNGDGDCNDIGDHTIYFDGALGGNASNIEMVSAQNVVWTPGGVLFVASANTSAGVDQVIRLEDLNQDGDANDVGEALSYYEPLPGGGSTGDSIVQDVRLGLDGNLYYLENGSTGMIAKGVYRLVDLDMSGDINSPAEVNPFFLPPALGATPFQWQFHQAPDGTFYMADTGNDVIWRFRDDNGDGSIDNNTEAGQYWTAGGASSLIWSVFGLPDGSLYCNESQAPDRLLRLRDLNSDGAIDPATEVEEIYDDTISGVVIGNPRGLWVVAPTDVGTAYCFGDGTGTICPCGNLGAPGAGCANSAGSGATLTATGNNTIAADSVVLEVVGGPPNRQAVFFQGTTELTGGTLFGDGLRCVTGPVLRLELTTTDGAGAASSTIALAAAAGLVPGDARSYQFWYRDPVGSSCGQLFNTSNGFTVLWQ